MKTLVFATRPSALARWQTDWVIAALQAAWPDLDVQVEVVTTRGDRVLDRPLPEIGGKGLFTQELEAALRAGRVDAAVHSLKDLPVDDPPGLTLGAIPPRAEAGDALVASREYSLDTLPDGAMVGTSSLRRSAQLLSYRPDLEIKALRGNVDTRVRKAQQGDYDAVVLATAGLTRLGLAMHITQRLPMAVMLPAPGQGALAVQCREDDPASRGLLAAIDHPATRLAVAAERSFLAGLGGGCSLPVGAFARLDGERIDLQGVVAAPDGQTLIRLRGSGDDPLALGKQLSEQALSEGAREVLYV